MGAMLHQRVKAQAEPTRNDQDWDFIDAEYSEVSNPEDVQVLARPDDKPKGRGDE